MPALLVDPIFIFWLLLGFGVIGHLVKRPWLSRSFIYLAAFWLFLVTISPFPVWLTRSLEKNYPVLDVNSIPGRPGTLIVILGGGYSFDPQLPPTGQLSNIALGRLTEAIRIYRQLPGSKLVCSGATFSINEAQAYVTARAAITLGVSPADTTIIPSPRNTAEEARACFRRFGKGHQLILVTSAVHMKRAMQYFEAQGLSPIPAPGDHLVKIDPEKTPFTFKPSISRIRMMEASLHEYAGLLKFKFSNRQQ
jgi:uncharacterized SAM-binding protein YcdF (DUF218 family)